MQIRSGSTRITALAGKFPGNEKLLSDMDLLSSLIYRSFIYTIPFITFRLIAH